MFSMHYTLGSLFCITKINNITALMKVDRGYQNSEKKKTDQVKKTLGNVFCWSLDIWDKSTKCRETFEQILSDYCWIPVRFVLDKAVDNLHCVPILNHIFPYSYSPIFPEERQDKWWCTLVYIPLISISWCMDFHTCKFVLILQFITMPLLILCVIF